jgi:hypothetical protein
MISRVWHGWTTPANAETYQRLLVTTILPGIAARRIAGYLGVRLDRRDAGDEVEFVTTMLFASEAAVAEFAGSDATVSVVPAAARAVLSRFDAHAAHYTVIAGGCPRPASEPEPYPTTQPQAAR